VLTARAGTRLRDIEGVLDQQGQMLSFEPPGFSDDATIGGTLACNLSGPARPWGGSIRDLVLGVRLINGKGERLRFGGQVMKNVAGYDVARLQAGALGNLGVITEVSLKVLPKPERTETLVLELDQPAAIVRMNELAGTPKPLTGAAWLDGRLYVRLAGADSAVAGTIEDWGGELMPPDFGFWQQLKEHQLPFFAGDAPLWRLAVRPTSAPLIVGAPVLVDWAGGLRWLRGDHLRLDVVQTIATRHGGHATLFRGGDRSLELRQPLDAAQQRLHLALKRAFDPAGILNRGALYSWMV
jgi:glycolate oxidase FAD binding subunit